MQFNFNQVILDVYRKPMKSMSDQGKDLTLGEMCIMALINPMPNDNIEPIEKRKRTRLADKIMDAMEAGGELDITIHQTKLLADLLGKAYNPVPATRALDILDPQAED